jgi:hypothetical protein
MLAYINKRRLKDCLSTFDSVQPTTLPIFLTDEVKEKLAELIRRGVARKDANGSFTITYSIGAEYFLNKELVLNLITSKEKGYGK